MAATASAMKAEGWQNFLNILSQSMAQAGLYAEKKGTQAKQKKQYQDFYESLFGTGLVQEDKLKGVAMPSSPAKGIYETPETLAEDVRIPGAEPAKGAAVPGKTPTVAEVLRAFASNPEFLDNPLIKNLVNPMTQYGTAQETQAAKAAEAGQKQVYESAEAEKERTWKSKEAKAERDLKRELENKRNSLQFRLTAIKGGDSSRDKRLEAANSIKSLVTSEEKLIANQLTYGQMSQDEANARRVYLNFLKGPALEVFRETVGEAGKTLAQEDWGILESAIMALSDPKATDEEKRDAQMIVNSLRTRIGGTK